MPVTLNQGLKPYQESIIHEIDCKFQRCPFNVGKPFFRWGYVILSQNKSDLVVFFASFNNVSNVSFPLSNGESLMSRSPILSLTI